MNEEKIDTIVERFLEERKDIECPICQSMKDFSYRDMQGIIGADYASKLSKALKGEKKAMDWFNTRQKYMGHHLPACFFDRNPGYFFRAIGILAEGDELGVYSLQ